jgi:hypothetical protein
MLRNAQQCYKTGGSSGVDDRFKVSRPLIKGQRANQRRIPPTPTAFHLMP